MRIRTIMTTGAVFLALGCASSAADRVDDKAAAKLASMVPTGKTADCLSLRAIDDITAVDEETFLVRAGARYYVSRTGSRCAGATRSFNRIEHRTTQAQLCRNEIISIVDNQTGMLNGSCSMGSFEELAPAPAAE